MPTILPEKCILCLKCVKECPGFAITIETWAISDTCIHCGHCVAICPVSAVLPDAGPVIPLQNTEITPACFRNLCAQLRTCRNFLKKEVEKEKLMLLVRNMKHYPSASNARPVEITIIYGFDKVQALNDRVIQILMKTLTIVTLPVVETLLNLIIPSLDASRLRKYKNQYIERQKTNTSLICHHAPVVILFHAKGKSFGMSETDAVIWATYTSLYAHTLGLGTCFNGFIVKAMGFGKELRKTCQIPSGHKVFAALLLGYPNVKYTNETSRPMPASSII